VGERSDPGEIEARAREIVAEEWDPAEAEGLRVLDTRRVHCARIVQERPDGRPGRMVEVSDAPPEQRLHFRWDGEPGGPSGYREAALASLPDSLRSRVDQKLRTFDSRRRPPRVEVQTELVAECDIGARSERVWVGIRSGHVLSYRNRGIGARRGAVGLGLLTFILLGPTIACVIDRTAGAIVTSVAFIALIVLVIRYAGGGDGGAGAWKNVR